jgi:hypothetical protein
VRILHFPSLRSPETQTDPLPLAIIA